MQRFCYFSLIVILFIFCFDSFSQENQEPYLIIDKYIRENNFEKAVGLLLAIYNQDAEGRKIINKFLNEREKEFAEFVIHARQKIKQYENIDADNTLNANNKKIKTTDKQKIKSEISDPVKVIQLVRLDTDELKVNKLPEQQFFTNEKNPGLWKIDRQALINTINYELMMELDKIGLQYTTDNKSTINNAGLLKIKIKSLETGYWSAYPFKSKHAKANLDIEYELNNGRKGSFSMRQQVDVSEFSKLLTTRVNRMLALGELIGEKIAFHLTFLVK